ncbi:hypothetical protein [Pseudomonas syringae]|uniref:hypothetical protein n=1 Tax=Pseudomonas syringae TaxID=317 RepID=UPI000366FFC2|nr:hypothetical protein [Pseudomonas syringae]MDU8540424.1 hypothetical protein [Pseudomonas syringae pv. actinidiae]
MKKLLIPLLVLASAHVFAASSELSTASTPTVDAVKLCKGYFNNDPEAVKAFNELKDTGAMDVATVCTRVQASGELDKPGPEAVAISLMSQFYEVKPDTIKVTVHHETSVSANLTATAPGGHSCVFSMVPAPPGAPAPNGWMVGSTVCNRR